ncbi:putative 6-phospho-beta-glucosidase [Geobacillus sp. BCO2]|nr:putative 6-phospho-beta-glucosidase [Geobacillus sp. BCO2]
MLAEELEAAKTKGTRAEVVQQLEKELFELYKDPNLAIKPPQLEQRGGAYYSDAACSLISSIYNDKRDIQPVNTRNNGAIASIPAESAVEVNCVITKDGPKPIAIGDLPVAVRGLVQQIKSFERVAAEAAVTGDYRTALVAMTINRLCRLTPSPNKCWTKCWKRIKNTCRSFSNKPKQRLGTRPLRNSRRRQAAWS